MYSYPNPHSHPHPVHQEQKTNCWFELRNKMNNKVPQNTHVETFGKLLKILTERRVRVKVLGCKNPYNRNEFDNQPIQYQSIMGYAEVSIISHA